MSQPFGATSQVVVSPNAKKRGEGDFFKPGQGPAAAEFHKLDDILMVSGLKGVELFARSEKGEGLGKERVGIMRAYNWKGCFENHFGEDEATGLKVAESLNGKE